MIFSCLSRDFIIIYTINTKKKEKWIEKDKCVTSADAISVIRDVRIMVADHMRYGRDLIAILC